MRSTDFASGSSFFDVEDVPVVIEPSGRTLVIWPSGKAVPDTTGISVKARAFGDELTPAAFDALVARVTSDHAPS